VLEAPARDEDHRELVVGLGAGRLERQRRELGLAARELELLLVEDRRVRPVGRHRPHEALAAEPLEAHAREVRRQRRDLVHDVGRRRVVHRVAQGRRHGGEDLEVGLRAAGRRDRGRDELQTPLGVRERPLLLQEGGGGEDHVGELRGLGLEDVLADEELERLERLDDVVRVGVRLRDVLAEDVHRLESPATAASKSAGSCSPSRARAGRPTPPRRSARRPRRRPSGTSCTCPAARPCPRSPGRCSAHAAAGAPSPAGRSCRS